MAETNTQNDEVLNTEEEQVESGSLIDRWEAEYELLYASKPTVDTSKFDTSEFRESLKRRENAKKIVEQMRKEGYSEYEIYVARTKAL